MSLGIILAFVILLGTLVVFALERFPVDLVALSIMVLILILGPVLNVKPEEAIAGFSNVATITVMAMFILSGGIDRTGLVNMLAHRMIRFSGSSEGKQLLTVALVVGPISAFINNTAAVAILMPVVITMAHKHRRAPSKLLMPLSFFSQLAGVITLIGTSTNVLASSLLAQSGFRPFGMFEFSAIGLLIFTTGALYFLLIGRRLLPDRQVESEITGSYDMTGYLSEVTVRRGSPLVGKNLAQSQLREQFDIHVLEIFRNNHKLAHPLVQHSLQPGDLLFIKANRQRLLKIKDMEGLAMAPEAHHGEEELASNKMGLLEVVIGPTSDLVGEMLESCNFRYRYGCSVIAIKKGSEIIQERLGQVRLEFGDTLLLRGFEPALEQVKRGSGFIITEELKLEEFRTEKAGQALAIVLGVVVVTAMGVSIVVTALAGCVLMVLTGCLKMHELHESIRWDVLFLLAGVIPLGLALERTGATELLANFTAQSANYVSPLFILIIFYLMSAILTELISNNATVVVLAPVGIATATTLGLDPRAFVLAIMFAASTSFATPVGYQTNTMIYGPGGYRFLDFLRVGGLLNLILAMTTPIYIYLLWGLYE